MLPQIMASSVVAPEEKFEAAVRVIQSLPKNGSFQPSNEMMLRFYGLYKQAKFGTCAEPRPAFWDVVRRAKWDAWKKLEALSQETAMLQYVEELKKVIETMPHTPDVSAFLETLGNFYELVDVEEAAVASEEAAKASSVPENGQSQRIRQSIKLAASRMHRSRDNSGTSSPGEERVNGGTNGPLPPLNGGSELSSPDGDFSEEEEEEDEEFCDVASSRSFASLPRAEEATLRMVPAPGQPGFDANGLGMDQLVSSGGGALSQHILRSLSRLEHDLRALSSRLDAMEGLLRSRLPDSAVTAGAAVASGAGPGGSGRGGSEPPRRPWWWQLPFDRLALRNVVFIVLWPLFVQFVGRVILRRLRARSLRRMRALPQ